MEQQWTKARLEDWARDWTRTPMTVLKAFIDAGFCSDEPPSREIMPLLRPPAPGTDDATEPDAPCLLSEAIARLTRATWDTRVMPNRQDVRILLDATKAVMPNDARSVIQGLLKYCNPIGAHGDHFRAKALKLLQRPEAPTDGRCVWYRGWECCPDGEGRHGQIAGWVAYLGGADADCITVDARTWAELLDEIDDHDKTEEGA